MMNRALRFVRVYHDLNQADAAARIGISRSYISEIESGTKKITLEVLQKYSDAFDIPVSSLMLFAEKTDNGGFAEDARTFIADKALKMLDWVETISDDRRGERNG